MSSAMKRGGFFLSQSWLTMVWLCTRVFIARFLSFAAFNSFCFISNWYNSTRAISAKRNAMCWFIIVSLPFRFRTKNVNVPIANEKSPMQRNTFSGIICILSLFFAIVVDSFCSYYYYCCCCYCLYNLCINVCD